MQVDGLYHVVRAFPGESIAHTEGGMDAVRDINIIRHELIMKDLDIVGRKVKDMGRKAAKTQDKMLKEEYEIILKV
jgi:obg-like ATPase 1